MRKTTPALFSNLVKCLNAKVAFDQVNTFKSHKTTTTKPFKPNTKSPNTSKHPSRSMKANIKQKKA